MNINIRLSNYHRYWLTSLSMAIISMPSGIGLQRYDDVSDRFHSELFQQVSDMLKTCITSWLRKKLETSCDENFHSSYRFWRSITYSKFVSTIKTIVIIIAYLPNLKYTAVCTGCRARRQWRHFSNTINFLFLGSTSWRQTVHPVLWAYLIKMFAENDLNLLFEDFVRFVLYSLTAV